MIRKSTTTIAMLLVLAGAVLVAGPVFGFTTLAADRGVSVQTADGGSALLGVESEGDVGELRGDADPRRVGTLFNNLPEDIDVLDVEIHNDDGVLAVDSPSPGTTISAGDSQNVTVRCGASQSLGVRTIEIEIVEVDGESTSISGVSFTTTVDIQCNKGSSSGAVNFQADDVSVDDSAQTFRFTADGLKNQDTASIDLSEPQGGGGVDYTGGSATVVSGSGSVQYDASTDRIVYTASGNPMGTVEIRIDGIDVGGNSGDRHTITYTDQRKNDPDRNDSDIFYITN